MAFIHFVFEANLGSLAERGVFLAYFFCIFTYKISLKSGSYGFFQ